MEFEYKLVRMGFEEDYFENSLYIRCAFGGRSSSW